MESDLRRSLSTSYNRFLKRGLSGITSSSRVLPDFIIIGAVRCGTTSLYYDICEHPSVLPAAYDEIGFFDSNFNLGIEWYRSMFPTKKEMVNVYENTGFAITGEDTPFYFWKDEVVDRISKEISNCKFLVILRNPIDRAYSNYQLGKRTNVESSTFEEAIHREMKTLQNNIEREHFDNKYSYIAKGIYHIQLKMWYKKLPRENFLVLSTEELSSKPTNTLNRVYNFLSIPEYELKKPHKKKFEEYEHMSDSIREELSEYFKPHNEELYSMLGRRFEWN